MSLPSRVDHLVVAAASLPEGIAWCRETFGFEPAAGGEHALMGTHNRVFRIDSPAYPRAYFEIIAIDPAAPQPGRMRWYDLDDASLQARIASGPRLVHFVTSASNALAAADAMHEQGIDRGALLAVERPTPSGVLRWRISVRDDGQRLFDGTLPTLIEWGDAHPCDSLPASAVALRTFDVEHPQEQRLRRAFDAIGLQQVGLATGSPKLIATFATQRGTVRLES